MNVAKINFETKEDVITYISVETMSGETYLFEIKHLYQVEFNAPEFDLNHPFDSHAGELMLRFIVSRAIIKQEQPDEQPRESSTRQISDAGA